MPNQEEISPISSVTIPSVSSPTISGSTTSHRRRSTNPNDNNNFRGLLPSSSSSSSSSQSQSQSPTPSASNSAGKKIDGATKTNINGNISSPPPRSPDNTSSDSNTSTSSSRCRLSFHFLLNTFFLIVLVAAWVIPIVIILEAAKSTINVLLSDHIAYQVGSVIGLELESDLAFTAITGESFANWTHRFGLPLSSNYTKWLWENRKAGVLTDTSKSSSVYIFIRWFDGSYDYTLADASDSYNNTDLITSQTCRSLTGRWNATVYANTTFRVEDVPYDCATTIFVAATGQPFLPLTDPLYSAAIPTSPRTFYNGPIFNDSLQLVSRKQAVDPSYPENSYSFFGQIYLPDIDVSALVPSFIQFGSFNSTRALIANAAIKTDHFGPLLRSLLPPNSVAAGARAFVLNPENQSYFASPTSSKSSIVDVSSLTADETLDYNNIVLFHSVENSATTLINEAYNQGDFIPMNCYTDGAETTMACSFNITTYPAYQSVRYFFYNQIQNALTTTDETKRSIFFDDPSDGDETYVVETRAIQFARWTMLPLRLLIFIPYSFYTAQIDEATKTIIIVVVFMVVLGGALTYFALYYFVSSRISFLSHQMVNDPLAEKSKQNSEKKSEASASFFFYYGKIQVKTNKNDDGGGKKNKNTDDENSSAKSKGSRRSSNRSKRSRRRNEKNSGTDDVELNNVETNNNNNNNKNDREINNKNKSNQDNSTCSTTPKREKPTPSFFTTCFKALKRCNRKIKDYIFDPANFVLFEILELETSFAELQKAILDLRSFLPETGRTPDNRLSPEEEDEISLAGEVDDDDDVNHKKITGRGEIVVGGGSNNNNNNPKQIRITPTQSGKPLSSESEKHLASPMEVTADQGKILPSSTTTQAEPTNASLIAESTKADENIQIQPTPEVPKKNTKNATQKVKKAVTFSAVENVVEIGGSFDNNNTNSNGSNPAQLLLLHSNSQPQIPILDSKTPFYGNQKISSGNGGDSDTASESSADDDDDNNKRTAMINARTNEDGTSANQQQNNNNSNTSSAGEERKIYTRPAKRTSDKLEKAKQNSMNKNQKAGIPPSQRCLVAAINFLSLTEKRRKNYHPILMYDDDDENENTDDHQHMSQSSSIHFQTTNNHNNKNSNAKQNGIEETKTKTTGTCSNAPSLGGDSVSSSSSFGKCVIPLYQRQFQQSQYTIFNQLYDILFDENTLMGSRNTNLDSKKAKRIRKVNNENNKKDPMLRSSSGPLTKKDTTNTTSRSSQSSSTSGGEDEDEEEEEELETSTGENNSTCEKNANNNRNNNNSNNADELHESGMTTTTSNSSSSNMSTGNNAKQGAKSQVSSYFSNHNDSSAINEKRKKSPKPSASPDSKNTTTTSPPRSQNKNIGNNCGITDDDNQDDETTSQNNNNNNLFRSQAGQLRQLFLEIEIDRVKFITEAVQELLIKNTGAYVIDHRNDYFLIALRLSKRNVQSKLGFRFVTQLIQVAEAVSTYDNELLRRLSDTVFKCTLVSTRELLRGSSGDRQRRKRNGSASSSSSSSRSSGSSRSSSGNDEDPQNTGILPTSTKRRSSNSKNKNNDQHGEGAVATAAAMRVDANLQIRTTTTTPNLNSNKLSSGGGGDSSSSSSGSVVPDRFVKILHLLKIALSQASNVRMLIQESEKQFKKAAQDASMATVVGMQKHDPISEQKSQEHGKVKLPLPRKNISSSSQEEHSLSSSYNYSLSLQHQQQLLLPYSIKTTSMTCGLSIGETRILHLSNDNNNNNNNSVNNTELQKSAIVATTTTSANSNISANASNNSKTDAKNNSKKLNKHHQHQQTVLPLRPVTFLGNCFREAVTIEQELRKIVVSPETFDKSSVNDVLEDCKNLGNNNAKPAKRGNPTSTNKKNPNDDDDDDHEGNADEHELQPTLTQPIFTLVDPHGTGPEQCQQPKNNNIDKRTSITVDQQVKQESPFAISYCVNTTHETLGIVSEYLCLPRLDRVLASLFATTATVKQKQQQRKEKEQSKNKKAARKEENASSQSLSKVATSSRQNFDDKNENEKTEKSFSRLFAKKRKAYFKDPAGFSSLRSIFSNVSTTPFLPGVRFAQVISKNPIGIAEVLIREKVLVPSETPTSSKEEHNNPNQKPEEKEVSRSVWVIRPPYEIGVKK